jgi:hypothetical protein
VGGKKKPKKGKKARMSETTTSNREFMQGIQPAAAAHL